MIFCKSDNKPSIAMKDKRIILSLPDAMTPVVWMIDLDKSGTFFMRVEQDENGLYVLQKIEGAGKSAKIEDVAYYADRKKAINALAMTVKVLSGGRYGLNRSFLYFFAKILKFFAYAVVMTFIILFILAFLVNIFIGDSQQSAQQQAAVIEPLQNEIITSDPNAVGEPMSADNFLSNNQSGLFPF